MVIVSIIAWFVLVCSIYALTNKKAFTIVYAIALAGYFYSIHSEKALEPNIALALLVYGIVLFVASIYFFVNFINNLRHNRILAKQPTSKQIVFKRATEILNDMQSFDEIKYIQLCINDGIIKKNADIAFYPNYENSHSFWRNTLIELYEPIEMNMVKSMVLTFLHETGAFTLEEALSRCKEDEIVCRFTKLHKYIATAVVSLVDEKQIEKVHMSNEQYLYKNISGIGTVMKSTTIEM